jgi:protein-S-isoprenylcysteine O-methyltransferase Ste14
MIWMLFLISPFLYNLLYWWWNPLTTIFPDGWYFLSGYVQVGGWLESPLYVAAPFVVAFGMGIFLASLAQVLRAKVYKKGLVTSGLYGLVRHPQHLGIAIAAFGLVMWNIIGVRVGDLIAWMLIVFMYILLAESEEERLLETYDERYLEYKRRVPFLLPLLPSMYGRLPKMLPNGGWRRRLAMIELYAAFLTVLIIVLANIPTVQLR